MDRDDLQKLIDTIVSELMPAMTARPQGRCACHSVLDDCCPDRLRGVLDREIQVTVFKNHDRILAAHLALALAAAPRNLFIEADADRV